MSAKSGNPSCVVCLTTTRVLKLHGDYWLCRRCEQDADAILCGPYPAGAPYADDLRDDIDEDAAEACG